MMFKFTREKDLNFVHIHCTVTKTNTKCFSKLFAKKNAKTDIPFYTNCIKMISLLII